MRLVAPGSRLAGDICMERRTFRSRQRQRAVVVVALSILGALAVMLIYGGEQALPRGERQASDSTGLWLLAALQGQSSPGAAAAKPAPAERPIRLVRAPVRAIKDDGAVFTDVAVD